MNVAKDKSVLLTPKEFLKEMNKRIEKYPDREKLNQSRITKCRGPV